MPLGARENIPQNKLAVYTRWEDINGFMRQIVEAGVTAGFMHFSGPVDYLTKPGEYYTEENTNRVRDYYTWKKKQHSNYFSSALFENEELPQAEFHLRYFTRVPEIQNILWDYELYLDSSNKIGTRRIAPEHCAFLLEAMEQFAQRRHAGPRGGDPPHFRTPGTEIAKESNFFTGHPVFPIELVLTGPEGSVLPRHQDFLKEKLQLLKDTPSAIRKAKALVDFYHESSPDHH